MCDNFAEMAAVKPEYKLVCEGKDEFDKSITDHLTKGWKLYGNPFLGPRNSSIYYSYDRCQAVIKKASSKKKVDTAIKSD